MAKSIIPLLARWKGLFSRRGVRDRRKDRRFPCSLDASCYLLASLEGDTRPIKVRNISAGGISLVVNRPIEPQTYLTIDLANELQGFRCQLRIQVIYNLEHPSGDWIIGAAFTRRLADHELRSFLLNQQ